MKAVILFIYAIIAIKAKSIIKPTEYKKSGVIVRLTALVENFINFFNCR